MEHQFPHGAILRLVTGDITRIAADAIVNAANSGLRGGGGVDGAIHRAGGPGIMQELNEIRKQIGHCPTGSAVATAAGALPARFVFHAVGPVYSGKARDRELLASCYRTCLDMAEERGCAVVTFPSISTGVYGYPMQEAAEIALETVARHLSKKDTEVREAIFVLFDERAYEVHAAVLRKNAHAPGDA